MEKEITIEDCMRRNRMYNYDKVFAILMTIVIILTIIMASVGFSVSLTLAILDAREADSEPATTISYRSVENIPDTIIEPLPEPEVVNVAVEEDHLYFDVPLDEDLQSYIFELCEDTGIDASIIIAMIGRESTYRDYVVGDSGRSYGLMQIQARWHGERMEELGCTDLLDPYQNVTVGIDYLNDLYIQSGSLEWALMAYNGGPSYANRKAAQGIVSDYALGVITESKKLVVKS